MGANHVLAVYEAASRLSGEMLAAARESEWDRLISLEGDCRELLTSLAVDGEETSADAEYRQRKAALIHRILEDDAEIRRLVDPWMEHLSRVLGQARQQTRIQQAYGGTEGSSHKQAWRR